MKFQINPNSCGPAAVTNALKVYGLDIPLIEAKPEGTDENGIKQLLKRNGFKSFDFEFKSFVVAYLILRLYLYFGKPVIMCVDRYDHWVTAIAQTGSKTVVVDSELDNENVSENGIHLLGYKQLKDLWTSPEFYGIIVLPQ